MRSAIKKVMKDKTLTQVNATKYFKVSQSYISKILAGKHKSKADFKVLKMLHDKHGFPYKKMVDEIVKGAL